MANCLLRSRVLHRSAAVLRRNCSSSANSDHLEYSFSGETNTLKPSLPQIQPSTDADAISQILLRHHNPFHPMESVLHLAGGGVTLSAALIHQILLRLRHSSKLALAFFHFSLKSNPNSQIDAAAFNLLIDILCKVHQFDSAWNLIILMDQLKIPPNLTTLYILIRRLIAAGFTRQAIRAYTDMLIFIGGDEEDNINRSFFYLLDTLCKYGYVKLAVEIFNKEKWRLNVDCKVYTILIYGWCKVKRIEMARRFLAEMIEKRIDPNVVTYNVLLNGICRRASLHPEGRFERVIRDAEKVFDEMTERGIEPDVTSYSILLHVYSRAHKPVLCLEKLREMRGKGICPSIASYTSVVKCLCSCGMIEEAEALLEEMVSGSVSPTASTLNCFFKEYRGRKDVDGALRLYGKMKDGTLCSPSESTLNILLSMFVNSGRLGLAREIWDDMKNSSTGPDLDSYTVMIHGLCKKKKWRDACELFMEMIEKGFLPQKVTFEMLYSGLIQSDMLRTWRRLKKRLDEESITFGSEFEGYHLNPYRR